MKKTVLIICPECKHQIEVNPGTLLGSGPKEMTNAARLQRTNAVNARWAAHRNLMSACGKYGILEPNDVYVKILDARRVNGLTEYRIMTDNSKRWVNADRVIIREEASNDR